MAENKGSKKGMTMWIAAIAVIVVIVALAVFVVPNLYTAPSNNYTPTTTIPSNATVANNTVNSPSNGTYSVQIATLPGIGQYLVNSTGWALYMYVPDTPNSGLSTCYGHCAVAWPIFYAANLTVQPGINSTLFSTIKRTDGTYETTFNGYPLYYYAYDTGAGNINGQNVGNIWYLMSPSGTIIKNTT